MRGRRAPWCFPRRSATAPCWAPSGRRPRSQRRRRRSLPPSAGWSPQMTTLRWRRDDGAAVAARAGEVGALRARGGGRRRGGTTMTLGATWRAARMPGAPVPVAAQTAPRMTARRTMRRGAGAEQARRARVGYLREAHTRAGAPHSVTRRHRGRGAVATAPTPSSSLRATPAAACGAPQVGEELHEKVPPKRLDSLRSRDDVLCEHAEFLAARELHCPLRRRVDHDGEIKQAVDVVIEVTQRLVVVVLEEYPAQCGQRVRVCVGGRSQRG